MRFGRYAEATVAFRRAAKKHGRWVPKDLSRKLAWSVFNGENPGEAVELFTKIGRRDRSRRTWSQYWTARALQDAGKIEEARDGYESLLARSETDFYGLMADSRLRELKRKADAPDAPDAPPTTLAAPEPALVPQDPSPTPEKLESILAATGALQHEPSDRGTLAWTAAMLQIDPAWQPGLPQEEARRSALVRLDDGWSNVAPEATRAAELHRLGFLEEARNELRVLATDLRIMGSRKWGRLVGRARSDMLDNRRDKKARGGASLRHAGRRSRAQAREFYKATRGGAFRATLQEAREALGDNHAIRWKSIRSGILRRRIAANTEEGYRKAYPIAWPEAMRISTKDHDVPPAFLYGIMTTESSFHPHAVSVAHAYGLVQMIPRTGRRVALELGYGEFMPEVLLDPSPSIYMGGRYMGRLLDRFYDQEPLAAAAYNAGPHRVADWLKANPDRPLDVFVEEIPYGQARRYTKKVLSHTARYRRLYYGEDRMYVTNHLESRHRTSPNY